MSIGLKANKELIGQLMVLISSRCKPLYHTKLLKLLYVIDEEATLRTGTPITWLNYNAWQYGPVAEDIYYSKNAGHNKFSQYVIFNHAGGNKYIVKPVVEFSDAEFSDTDLRIANEVIEKYGRKSTRDLVGITHAEGSLWQKTVQRANIHFSESNRTSDVSLNFAELIENDGFKKTVYYTTLENIELQASL
ncbi:MAG: Panacea domain-containing protein [Marinilabiliaceae bacterium]|nr:Panacea domain-containing protein [Marinilabiliaceae bacterium]